MHLCWEKQNAHTQNIIVRFWALKVIDTFIKMFDEQIYDTSGTVFSCKIPLLYRDIWLDSILLIRPPLDTARMRFFHAKTYSATSWPFFPLILVPFLLRPPRLRLHRRASLGVRRSGVVLLFTYFSPCPLLALSLILEDGLTTWTAPFAWISISKIVDPRPSFPGRRRYPFLVWINSLNHTASVEYFWIIFKFLTPLLLSIIHATLFTRPRYFLSASITARPYSVLDVSLR